MSTPSVQPYRPSSDPDVRRAKRQAREAWLAVSDAQLAGVDRETVERLRAAAITASDAWYAVRGVERPQPRKGVAA